MLFPSNIHSWEIRKSFFYCSKNIGWTCIILRGQKFESRCCRIPLIQFFQSFEIESMVPIIFHKEMESRGRKEEMESEKLILSIDLKWM